MLSVAEWQPIKDVDYPDLFHVEGGQAFVGSEIKRVGDEAGSISGGGLVQRVAIVERFGKSVNSADRKAVAEAATQIQLQGVIRAGAFGKPSPSVGDGGIGLGRSGRNVLGACGKLESARCLMGE